jgi:uroporphyrinogen-III synthase
MNDVHSLGGAKIVLTREDGVGSDYVEALIARGAHVVAVPLTRTAPPSDGGARLATALGTVKRFAWLVVTSARGVDAIFERVKDAAIFSSLKVGVVGDATAHALARHGIEPDVVATKKSATSLVGAIGERGAESGAILYPRSAQALPALIDGLKENGWKVEDPEAYRTIPIENPHPLDTLFRADVVVVFAPSAVSALASLRMAGDRQPPPLVAIGETTGHAVRENGFILAAVAATPDIDGLVGALQEVIATFKRDEAAP